MGEPIYFDNSATTRVCDEAVQKMVEVMTSGFGNPSSLHRRGLDAVHTLCEARYAVAAALGCATVEVVFTSGGTEANNLAVLGAAHALRRRGNRIVTTAIEHSSVLAAMKQLETEGFEVVYLKPGADGSIREEDLARAVTPETVLVSIMLVNNETGAFQPVHAIKRAVERAGSPALIHCDAVQAFCKTEFTPASLGADLVSVSAHKIHGPMGAGALYIRRGARVLPLFFGGDQENSLRPGTEPMPAIAGFGAAAAVAHSGRVQFETQIAQLKARLSALLRAIPGVVLNSPEESLPNILNFSIPGVRSQVMLNYLSAEDAFVSSGSACSRGAKSHVLTAMGLSPARVDSALRVSFSRQNTLAQAERFAALIRKASETIEHVR